MQLQSFPDGSRPKPHLLALLSPRGALISVIVAVVAFQIAALIPASVEDTGSGSSMIDPETIPKDDQPAFAQGIPQHQIPEYGIDGYRYVSVQGVQKQWKLLADQAFMYSKLKLVHARTVQADLYNPDDTSTKVTAQEAKYLLEFKDLEMFGNVKAVLPDGFTVYSAYMRYLPKEKKIIIPETWYVTGEGQDSEDPNKKLYFESYGMTYDMIKNEIYLLTKSKVTVNQTQPNPEQKGVPETTIVQSDQCFIDRVKKLAHFTMDVKRPDKERFVRITQPKMYAQSRKADFNYGDYSKLLNYLIAYEDVTLKERETGPLHKYATSGRADFDTKRDLIILREYPQVYQDGDTVTGDIILMHRDTDVIEIEHSNSYSEGGNE